MTAYFSSLGVREIKHVTNPENALAMLNDNVNAFDLVVSDIKMPQMDGLEFMRHLSGCDYKGQFVIVSGIDQNLIIHAERLAKIYNLNMMGQITKPVMKSSLDEIFQTELQPIKDAQNANNLVSALKI